MHPQNADVDAKDREPERRETCSCELPVPHTHAESKWAARTFCRRCGLPLRLSWR